MVIFHGKMLVHQRVLILWNFGVGNALDHDPVEASSTRVSRSQSHPFSTKKSCHLPKRSEKTTGKMTFLLVNDTFLVNLPWAFLIKLWANWCFEELGSNPTVSLFHHWFPFRRMTHVWWSWGGQFSESPAVATRVNPNLVTLAYAVPRFAEVHTSPGAFFVWTLSDENELGDLHKVQCHDHQVEQ